MRLLLFSGFLGSGKTTLITTFARFLVESKGKKVMLIVNDVGDVGIDAQLMRKLNTDVHELFGGCICGQLGNLVNLLLGIGSKYDVETVIVEASGIAQPSRFIDTIRKFVPDEMDVRVVTLVDAERWSDLRIVMDELMESQVKAADLLLVNKVDTVDKGVLAAVIKDIESLRPLVPLFCLSANRAEEVFRIGEVMMSD